MTKHYAIDAESYADTAGCGVLDPASGEHLLFTTSQYAVGGLPLEAFPQWLDGQKDEAVFASINGANYDTRFLAAVVAGEFNPARLKLLSDSIINDTEEWRNRRSSIDSELHCDLLRMHGGYEQVAGSKEMAVKASLHSVRESPVAFDALATTEAEKRAIWLEYNRMDLDTIAWAVRTSERDIESRLALMEEYGINILSEPDAGVADHVMRARLYPTGDLPWPTADTWQLRGSTIADKVGDFYHPRLRALKDELSAQVWDFWLVQDADGKKIDSTRFSYQVELDGKLYNGSKGGLHTEDAPGFYVADERWGIYEFDFSSFYPSLILRHRLCPAHVPRLAFLGELDKLVKKRLAAKDAGNTSLANGLKIATNSIFGKSGSPWSWLCDPKALLSCCLLGQLSLFRAIDVLVSCELGIEVLSANTDSITFRCRRDDFPAVREAMEMLAHGL